MEALASARVAVFGIGGVGGYVVEALARSGVGALDLIDSDTVALSNLNRQIVALHSTVGQNKAEAMARRVADINPDARVRVYPIFYLPETADQFDFTAYDYVVDAIDTVAGKMELVRRAREAGVPIICSMGAGNKMDPTAFRVTDIHKTAVCPLAKVMRGLCRKEGIKHLKVVYSEEIPMTPAPPEEGTAGGKIPPASVIFAPAAAGLAIAAEVVKDLTKK
ncbi:MAG: tRNA threonylcarbamoyladenosine dehydratase [Clostridia bacterium]|nr:tRNA threonylcarbamoyladenosine dehydratase [Clostridia bacterium]